VLIAYSKHNPEVGYCQGMNYLAGLVLIGVEMRQDLAFTLIVRLMDGEGYNLSGLYEQSLRKLFEFTDHIYSWLLCDHPKLQKHMSDNGIPLTAMLASPFMALFANITDLGTSMHVLDRLMLQKTDALVNIIKCVLVSSSTYLLSMDDSEQMHPYFVKQIYFDAQKAGKFFPSI